MKQRLIMICLAVLWAGQSTAFELRVEKVDDGIYALVGDIGPRNEQNHGLNNTLGFIIGNEGVTLVGSGATPEGAQLIESAVAGVTDKPIRRVVTIGVQDHHWMGNSYFIEQDIDVIALANTVSDQKEQFEDQLVRLNAAIGTEAETVQPHGATKIFEAERQFFTLDGVDFELLWTGGAHFAGDAILWLPERKTVFTGDLVFHDRMLGVQPYSEVANWQKAFQRMVDLEPQHVIPGHGFPGDLAKAQRDTGDYLDWLMLEVGAAIEDWAPIDETVDNLEDAPQFKHLEFYDGWHRRNINRTYLELESAQ